MIGEIIIKYWLEFLLGLISSGLIALSSHFYRLYKKERKKKTFESEEHLISEVKIILDDRDKNLVKLIREEERASQQADILAKEEMKQIQGELAILKEGMLSIQGKQFKDECRALLEDNHHITLKEFENISNEHRVYNALEGNHEGDDLFKLVATKYHSLITK